MTSAVDNNAGYSSGVNFTTASDLKNATSQVKDQTLTQEDFLKLLTTQLECQDPTNPADNTELVSQMSQLSMVESLNSINSNMTGVIDTVNNTSTLNATSLIGTYVYTDSNKGYYDGGNTVAWSIDAGDETYSNLKLQIKDATTGQVVYTDTAEGLTGETKFAWPGIYSPQGPVADDKTGVQDPGTLEDAAANAEAVQGSTTAATDGTDTGEEGTDDGTSTGDGTENKDPEYTYCPSGKYILEVTGVNSSGQTVQLPTANLALVTSVTLGKTMEDTMLSLYGHDDISFSEAKKVTI